MLLKAYILAGVFACHLIAYLFYRKIRSLPLPPGPRKLPIIGNLLDIPKEFEWLTYSHWGKQLNSDLLHISAVGQNIIVINSVDIANDLLDKRSNVYSSRPSLTMLNDLMGYGWSVIFQRYGKRWREQRRLIRTHFPPSNTKTSSNRAQEYTPKLLLQLLQSPENFAAHTEHMVAGIIVSLAYGLEVLPKNDPLIDIFDQAISSIRKALISNTYLVNFIPALKYLPEWFPGAEFIRDAKKWRMIGEQFKEVPFSAAEKAFVDVSGRPSFISRCLENTVNAEDAVYQREIIKETAAAFFGAGAETTFYTLQTFILAMLCHPEVQKKAQKEIDTVIGNDRLPTFEDKARLPYLSAVISELLRWATVVPMGVPHCMIGDDIYNGYYIPKDSIVVANQWAMLHNEQDYPNPEKFYPERFLKKGEIDSSIRDPTQIVFGFGRRGCPGSSIALPIIWLAAAAILSTFDITDFVDENGRVVKPTPKFLSGLTLHPAPFKCTISPRSQASVDLVKSINEL